MSRVDLGAFELGLSKWRAWARAEMDTTAKWVRVSMPIGTLGRQSADVRAPSFLCEGTDIFVESFCHIMDMSLMAPPNPFFLIACSCPSFAFSYGSSTKMIFLHFLAFLQIIRVIHTCVLSTILAARLMKQITFRICALVQCPKIPRALYST